MATLKKATVEDFEKIYRLLISIEGVTANKEQWQRIFSDVWCANEGYCGYMLLEGQETVGFLGMIFSRREINGHPVKVCNLSSWVVKEKYRSDSLKLLMPIKRMKEYLITTMTARKDVSFIFGKLGFKPLDSAWVIIPPLPVFSSLSAGLRFQYSFGARKAAKILRGRDLKILEDHKDIECGHLVMSGRTEYCYVVYHRIWKKNIIPLVFVDYISDPALFLKSLGYIRLVLPAMAGAVGTIVDERLLKGHKGSLVFRKAMPVPSPRVYRSPADLNPEAVDNLYSELVLLGI